MPVAMSAYIQSVEINDRVYVGGGFTEKNEDKYIVMAYNTLSCQWHTLPPYSTRFFAMTTINNKLVVVGGRNRDGSDSSELGEWQPDSNQWTHPYPPMFTPRCWPSATSYKHWLVVAGGYHGACLQTSVEVLDVSNMQWSTGQSTPTPWRMMKSTTIADTWYLMGGECEKLWQSSPDVYSVSLEALVSHSSSDSSNINGTNYLHSTVHNPVHSTLEDLYWQSVGRVGSQCPPSSAMSLRLIHGFRLDNYHMQYVTVPVS